MLPYLRKLLLLTGITGFQHPLMLENNGLPSVAIIGAGAAGSSAAYHLANYTNGNVNIKIFESNEYVGGRTHTIEVEGVTVEVGASIYVDVNTILKDAVAEFNLSTRPGLGQVLKEDEDKVDFSIWDGKEFKFELKAGGKLSTYWQILRRFGWRAPLYSSRLTSQAVGNFLRLYDEYFPWTNLGEAVVLADIEKYLNVTAADYFDAQDIDEDYSDSFIQSLTRVNYSYDLDKIHALAALVSLAAESGVKSVEGGNWQIFEHMVNNSAALLALNTKVNSLEYDQITNKWTIDGYEKFDHVIIAAPFQFANIRVVPPVYIEPVEYVQLFNNYVLTDQPLDASGSFGSDLTYNTILTVPYSRDDEKYIDPLPYTSISHTAKTKSGNHLYKVFSLEKLNKKEFQQLFGNVTILDVITKEWFSYPKMKPVYSAYPDVEIGHNLYYTSSMDPMISTMETNALSGKNAAKLIADKLSLPLDN